MQHSPFRLVLPAMAYASGKPLRIERFYISERSANYWVAYRDRPEGREKTTILMPTLFIQGPEVEHGIIHTLPTKLGDLEVLCATLGSSLVKTISDQIDVIRAEFKGLEKIPLMIVAELPKRREKGGKVEAVERMAFIAGKNVGELFKQTSKEVQKGGIWVSEKIELFQDLERLKGIELMPLSVRQHLTPEFAAAMNGHPHTATRIVGLGAGSLGSPTINNLWRGGFGKWTLVDDDDLEPHNPARHLLDGHAVGHNKAHALSTVMQAVFPEEKAPAWMDCNYLTPGKEEATLADALKNAELILDFSASVTVERRLARDQRTTARRITAFLNQRGDESVLLVEAADRTVDLFWLEVLYMRAVALDSKMKGHFDDAGVVAHRYGNGCRDISATVPQDGVAIHAGLLSHRIRRTAASAEASVVISRWSRETGEIGVVDVPVVKPVTVEVADWRVMLHPDVIEKLREQRAQKLPNETGGILLGIADRTTRSLAIVDMLPAPPDSDVWPTSFIRGSNGLATAVDKVVRRTLGNVIYVGEWHSHPAGHDSAPSATDVAAVAICAEDTRAEGLPTLMLITASDEIGVVLKPPDDEGIYHQKIPMGAAQQRPIR